MPITLDEHSRGFITDQIALGRFKNETEVIQAGLRHLEQRELKLKELRSLIEEGDRDYAEGRYRVYASPKALIADVVSRGRARRRGTSS